MVFGGYKAIFFSFVLFISAAAQAQPVLQDLSGLGKSCTSRSFVSGVVEIPIQVSGATRLQVNGMQYSELNGWTFPKSDILLLEAGDGSYKIYLDTRRLYNGWANLDIYAYDSANLASGFSVYLYIQNASMLSSGALALLAPIVSGSGDSGVDSGSGGSTDSGDLIAPTIQITGLSPTRQSLTIYSTQSDNVGVTKVTCSIDGTLSASSLSSPFTVSLSLKRLARGTHQVQCKAYDAAGNAGSSASWSFVK